MNTSSPDAVTKANDIIAELFDDESAATRVALLEADPQTKEEMQAFCNNLFVKGAVDLTGVINWGMVVDHWIDERVENAIFSTIEATPRGSEKTDKLRFTDLDEFEKQRQNYVDADDDPIEDDAWTFKLVAAPSLEIELWKAMRPSTTNVEHIEEFLDRAMDDEDEQVRNIIYVTEVNLPWKMCDPLNFEMQLRKRTSMRELAEELVEDGVYASGVEDRSLINYEEIIERLEHDGWTETVVNCDPYIYHCN